MNEVLITGASGLVGSRVVELLKDKYQFITPDIPDFDLTNKETIKLVAESVPQVIIHFAAFTNVNEAEKQKDLCWQLNVDGTKNLLSLINIDSTHFINISTDMVFPGTNGPYSESDSPAQTEHEVTWYAWTKLQAEKLIDLNKSANVRIIYPVRANFSPKLDYLRGPLKKFDEGKLYPLFSDQIVSFAFIDELAQALDKIIQKRATRTYHVSSTDTGTPHEIISYLLRKARGFTGELAKSTVKQFPPNRYPWYGGLKTEITREKLGVKFSTWQQIIDQLVSQEISVDSH